MSEILIVLTTVAVLLGVTVFCGHGWLRERDRRRQAETRLEKLGAVAADWLWETDAEGRYTFLSDTYARKCGISAEETLGRTRDEFLAGRLPSEEQSDPEKWSDLNQVIETHQKFEDFVYSLNDFNGDVRTLRVSGEPTFDEKGNFQGYRGVGTNLTTQLDTERELDSRRRMLRSIIDNAPGQITLKDTDGRYRLVNIAFAEGWGLQPQDMIGKTLRESVGPDYIEETEEHDRAVVLSRKPIIRERSIVSPNGSTYAQMVTKFPIRNADGEVSGIGSFSNDITEL